MSTKVYNSSVMKANRRNLHRNATKPEQLLWAKLRNRQMNGHKFRRQYSFQNFVVDFYCPQAKLAVEIDGDSHYFEGARTHDLKRQHIIEVYGVKFLRFTNKEIMDNIEGVVEVIIRHLKLPSHWKKNTSPDPSLERRG